MSAAAILSKPLCALAFCWRLERRDGVTIGLTSHDRGLRAHGLRYAAAPGITPSAIVQGGNDPDLTDLQGAISSAAISEVDLDAGRWDGATLLLHLTEWTEPGVLWLELARGELGSIERRGGAYSVSLRSTLAAALERPVAPVTSATCRATLGDADCRIDLRRHQQIVAVGAVADDRVACGGLLAGVYPFGSLRWLEGPNCGLLQTIVDQEAGGVFLAEPPVFPVAAGTRALLTQGCDKRLATCAARFGNAVNFRGEPHLPGMDLLTRYPGS
ncbi:MULTISPECIES: DUF2163 domain-containing protein [unclassified Sphingobium]|uniref:DUF2163 domain-containing protein n=1 Tax=unclassified Sphingobium TaxID=2611147 RepID=UPI0022241436|nr:MULTISPECIES: DUF2163 domain-containing protein [unclassified Sphingobium]MCW2411241.1 putative phage protein (TIGR02218 family) [Sphingobium sp. B8D3D]MCW2416467.1 putative phage protein (TIGR02218 family) [Sphingobium sp. B8D3A]